MKTTNCIDLVGIIGMTFLFACGKDKYSVFNGSDTGIFTIFD